MIQGLAGADPSARSRRVLLGLPARQRIVIATFQLADAASLTFAFLLATTLVPYRLEAVSIERFLSIRLNIVNFGLFLCLLLIWHLTFSAFGLYEMRRSALGETLNAIAARLR